MLKTLYLPSTPLNIFLSIAVAEQRRSFYGEEAIIILIDQPSPCSQQMSYLSLLSGLEKSPFKQCFSLQNDQGLRGKFITRNYNFSFLQELIANNPIEIVFVGSDRRIEFQYCMYQAKKHHASVRGGYLDDGLYTYVNSRTKWQKISDSIEFLCKKIRYPWLTQIKQIGASDLIQLSYVALPQLMLDASKEKQIEPLLPAWLTTDYMKETSKLACELFGCEIEIVAKIDVLVSLVHPAEMKLVSDYENRLKNKIKKYLEQGKTLAVKYHPREGQLDRLCLQELGNVYLVPHRLALEFVLPLLSTSCVVVSDRSTLALTAKMLRPDLSHLLLLQKSVDYMPLEGFAKKLQLAVEYW